MLACVCALLRLFPSRLTNFRTPFVTLCTVCVMDAHEYKESINCAKGHRMYFRCSFRVPKAGGFVRDRIDAGDCSAASCSQMSCRDHSNVSVSERTGRAGSALETHYQTDFPAALFLDLAIATPAIRAHSKHSDPPPSAFQFRAPLADVGARSTID